MQLSYNWLKEYLPKQISIEKLCDILTQIGLEVEGIDKFEFIKGSLDGLVTGKVLTCVPHPNADKLKLTTVSVGNSILPIVCGAPNVAEEQIVIVATVGTTVHPINGEAFEIKKAKIRGEVSEGMICAEDEIGLGNSHHGILVLPKDTPIGIPAKELYNIPEPDYTIHVGLTPNRSDAMSHIGVARDVGAYLAHHDNYALQDLLKQRNAYKKNEVSLNSDEKEINIQVDDTEKCKRYSGIVITNIKVESSPIWMQERLKAIGIRPINNIVDITNYVLHEYGQPLHAFDYDKIEGEKMVVKCANEGESFTTLDGKKIKLRSEDLMICDAEKSMCIAGVYGGQHSGVSDSTTTIFLESAYFDPRSVRRTSLHHQLRTDAATHFEKSVDMDYVIPALKRAVEMICDFASGKIATSIIDIYPTPIALREVTVSYQYIDSICGKNYETQSVDTILQALGFSIKNKSEKTITVIVPANKADVSQPADIAEEILRIDGLDNVPIPTNLNISLQKRREPKTRKCKRTVSEELIGKGFQEIITNSIINSKYYPDNTNLVKMINSLSSDLDAMRPCMLESGLEVVAYNANRKQQDLQLFEIGDVYYHNGVGNYHQEPQVAIWITGNTTSQQWQSKAIASDIYYIKGIIEGLWEKTGLKKYKEGINGDTIEWHRGKEKIASAYAVSSEKLKQFDIKQPVFYAEIYLNQLAVALENNAIRYSELTKYPAMKRDLALVLNKSVSYEQVAKLAKSQKLDALKNFQLFDVFENEKLGVDKKSLALSFTFQLYDRTLTDDEVDGMMQQIITSCQQELQAEVRMN